MAETKTLITAEEFERMSFPDERVELSEGELIRMPPGGIEHSDIGVFFISMLASFVDQRKLGAIFGPDAGFQLDNYIVRAPDVSFVSQAKLAAIGKPRGFWPGAPDLAIEVLSPGDSVTELMKKVQEYFRAGTRAVWVVLPDVRQVYRYYSPKDVRVLAVGDTLDGGDVIPGFSLPISQIFDR